MPCFQNIASFKMNIVLQDVCSSLRMVFQGMQVEINRATLITFLALVKITYFERRKISRINFILVALQNHQMSH